MQDVDELEQLYNELIDHLQTTTNYPCWVKDVYPTRETAEIGIGKNNLFILKVNNEIAGTIILNHEPEHGYDTAKWQIDAKEDEFFVIHTLAIHPKFLGQGIGFQLLQFAKEYAIQNKMKSIRLDVTVKNEPAIALYQKCGYQYIDTVDLGLNRPDLKWFKLFELVL